MISTIIKDFFRQSSFCSYSALDHSFDTHMVSAWFLVNAMPVRIE
jgi:hypothetical protein